MKKSTRRSRRHRNPGRESEQQSTFFGHTQESKVQAKEGNSFFQPKLEIDPSNSPAEKEADSTATKAVEGIQRSAQEEEPAAKLEVQRAAQEEEPAAKLEANDNKAQTPKQKKETASPLEERIAKTKGQGFELPDDIRQEMETQFGADFSQVRIHTDTQAIAMCRSIQAQAFAHGYDIYFNIGKYNPNTNTGKELLAHELTHVVQQKGH